MKAISKIVITALIFSGTLFSCKEELNGPPVTGITPEPVSNIQVENLPGAAMISYELPEKGALYAMAEYEVKDGKKREAKSSRFKEKIYVEGFPAEGSYEVTLYAVGDGDERSLPQKVTVHPTAPPVLTTFATLKLEPAFGGVSLRFENNEAADLKLVLLAEDSTQQMEIAETFYTKMKTGIVSKRGMEAKPRKFGVYVRDRYDNYSDTLYTTLTPLFEMELDKSKFAELDLPGDYNKPNNSGQSRMRNLWDGYTTGDNTRLFATVTGSTFPQQFSFDLGVTASLSRFRIYPRTEERFLYTNTPKQFEIWGSNVADGDWSHWTKLTDCEIIKPSGLPAGEFSNEDKQYVANGVDFEFPVGTPAMRFIRFRTLGVWSGSNIAIFELTFFGADK